MHINFNSLDYIIANILKIFRTNFNGKLSFIYLQSIGVQVSNEKLVCNRRSLLKQETAGIPTAGNAS